MAIMKGGILSRIFEYNLQGGPCSTIIDYFVNFKFSFLIFVTNSYKFLKLVVQNVRWKKSSMKGKNELTLEMTLPLGCFICS